MHHAADLCCTKAAVAAVLFDATLRHAGGVQRVVLVRALFEGGERSERQPAYAKQRRLGHRDEGRQLRRSRRGFGLRRGEELELSDLLLLGLDRRLPAVAVRAPDEAGGAALG